MIYLLLTITILTITLDAISDALNHRHFLSNKTYLGTLGHTLKAAFILLIMILSSVITISNFIPFIIAYSLLRFAIFDTIYNISMKDNRKWYFIGSTAVTDKIMKYFGLPDTYFLFPKFLCLLVGTSVFLRYININTNLWPF